MGWRDQLDTIRRSLDEAIRDLIPLDIPLDEAVEWGYDLLELSDQLYAAGVRLSWIASRFREEACDDGTAR
jgi:hypothetical protein